MEPDFYLPKTLRTRKADLSLVVQRHSSQPKGQIPISESESPHTSHMLPDSAFLGYSSTTEKAPGELLLRPMVFRHLSSAFRTLKMANVVALKTR